MRKTPEALAILNPDLPDVTAAVDAACARIAPTWPLDRFIAVNPFWGFTDAPVTQVCARLKALSGSRLLMPRSWYLEQWRTGKLRAEHLSEAARLAGSRRSA
ncbi:MAG TPA: putative inorganic carbon transporter subunit DabA, partial [Myxococcaceae bacterium]|nr:putative inorganic carbon transporter subunit DabA [Myxococcaceae bacterium]